MKPSRRWNGSKDPIKMIQRRWGKVRNYDSNHVFVEMRLRKSQFPRDGSRTVAGILPRTYDDGDGKEGERVDFS